MAQKSAYTLLCSLVNSMEIGEELSRYRMQATFRQEFGDERNVLSVDSYKSYFVKLGFLKPTGIKGFFTVEKHIPEGLRASDMRKMYNVATGYTDKQTVTFKEEITNAEYLQLKYKPVEFAVMFKMSYIQGAIICLLADHAGEREMLEAVDQGDEFARSKIISDMNRMLDKVVYYAKVADFMKHKNSTINTGNSSVDRFCEINGFDNNYTTTFKLTLRNKWTDVIKSVKNLKQ